MDQNGTIARDVPPLVAAETHGSEHVHLAEDTAHSRGLLLVGLFKLSKALLATASGFVAYHLTHSDPGEIAIRLITALHIDPMSRVAMALMDEADNISARGLRHLGEASFVLAFLYVVEGSGLMAKKVWAEYFTVVMTAGAIPWELHELIRRYTDVRLAVLLGNVGVVLYLSYLLLEKRRHETLRS